MLNLIGRGKGAKLRIIPAKGKGQGASSNIANPVPASSGWTEIAPGVWQCDGLVVGAATTLILAQEADGLVIGQSYLLSATITGTADILIRSGSTTLDANWDGSPTVFTPDNGNFNIFQRAGGYTIQSIVIRAATVAALGVESASEVGMAEVIQLFAPAATGIESASEVGSPVATILAPAATGVESASEVGMASELGDTTAPTMTDDSYDEGTSTFAATITEAESLPVTMHVLVTDTEPTTGPDIIGGTGLFKTTYEADIGTSADNIDFTSVPPGNHWLALMPVDAVGNYDFAEAHVVQYDFAAVATGVESASEVGAPVATIQAPAATGVESTSEVGQPAPGTANPPAVGVESASEVGTAVVSEIHAPAATGVESTSEVGSAAVSEVHAPAATGVESTSEVGEPTAPAAGSAPTFQAAGAKDEGAGAINTAWPTHQADDIGVFCLACLPGDAPDPPAGWTELISAGPASDAGLTIWWRRAAGASEGNVVISDIGNHHLARILTFRGCVTGSTPIVMLNSNSTTGSTSISITAGTTSGANRMVLGALATNLSAGGSGNPDLTAGLTNATLADVTNRIVDATAVGNDSGLYAATGTLASAGSTGAFTGTLGTSSEQQCAIFELIGA